MAYTSFAPTDLSEVLSQIDAFATNDLGWSSSWDGTTLTLTPIAAQAVFTLTEEADSYGDTGVPQLVLLTTEGAESFETVCSHLYSTALCWLFGGAEPEPWLHIVIQVSPGTYRHAYLGYLERYGTWTSGAICDANQVGRWGSTYYAYSQPYSHALFSGFSYWDFRRPVGRLGGVMVLDHGQAGQRGHARFGIDTPVGQTGALPADYPIAGGGPADRYARELIEPGVAPYSGEAALAPINVFADITRNGNWAPLGRVCGVRLVHIEEFNPEQLISYAGRTWRVFPWVRKPPAGTNEPDSDHIGIAVLEEL